MKIPGHVSNGVVVLEDGATLPEGMSVSVIPRVVPVIRVATERKRVEFPLVRSPAPGSVRLTNDMIAEILDAEDASP